jgi:hypothetical protein
LHIPRHVLTGRSRRRLVRNLAGLVVGGQPQQQRRIRRAAAVIVVGLELSPALVELELTVRLAILREVDLQDARLASEFDGVPARNLCQVPDKIVRQRILN